MTKKLKYDEKTQDLIDYLKGGVVLKRDNRERYGWIVGLEKCIDTFDSDVSDYQKGYEIGRIFDTPSTFRSRIKRLDKYENDEFLKDFSEKIKSVYQFFSDEYEKGNVDDARYLMHIKDYLKNYKYCDFIISSYINFNDSSFINVFLDTYGIDKDTFDFCLRAIMENDPILYSKYQEKCAENRTTRIKEVKMRIEEIANGIQTGFLSDGRKFDVLEFFRIFPFVDGPSTNEILTDFGSKYNHLTKNIIRSKYFLEENFPQYSDIIHKYMAQNKINNGSGKTFLDTYRRLDIGEIYRTRHIINGREITDEDKDKVLSYLKENNIPLISMAYSAAVNKYINGELNCSKVKAKRLTINNGQTLIP